MFVKLRFTSYLSFSSSGKSHQDRRDKVPSTRVCIDWERASRLVMVAGKRYDSKYGRATM